MKITSNIPTIIQLTLDRLQKGKVFTYEYFLDKVNNKEAVIKALNRMVEAGKLRKLSKGRYYKPEITQFGELPPSNYQVVKDLLSKDGKLLGYLTGFSIYNELGLTSQLSNRIEIGTNERRESIKRTSFTISFIKQKNKITKSNIPLLQVLDSIKNITKIPDTPLSAICSRLGEIISGLSDEKEKALIVLSLNYSPMTRALLGALLEKQGRASKLSLLSDSLNPITKYKLYGIDKALSSSTNWNFIK